MAASPSEVVHTLKDTYHSAAHSYGPNGELCVASDDKIHIFDLSGAKAVLTKTLCSHRLKVTDVDWNVQENKILSCGEDRNAYVWNLEENGEWRPTLVVLRVNRAAMCCKWAHSGKKFAVGTSARSIMICSYDEEHDFWVAKSIKKPKSAITCLAWHSSDLLLAAGGTDFKCRVYNAVDPECDGDLSGASALYGSLKKFGAVLGEFQSLGYVNDVAFNEEGNQLCFVSQSGQLTLVTFTGDGNTVVKTIQANALPFNSCLMVKDLIIAGGHDCKCFKYQVQGEDIGEQQEIPRAAKKGKGSNATTSAFNRFHNTTKKGPTTPHSFSISQLIPTADGFSTCANGDNHVLTWVL